MCRGAATSTATTTTSHVQEGETTANETGSTTMSGNASDSIQHTKGHDNDDIGVVIGIAGSWYSITNEFMKVHPGGYDILKLHDDHDATDIFTAWHANAGGMKLIQKYSPSMIKKVGSYERKKKKKTDEQDINSDGEEKKSDDDINIAGTATQNNDTRLQLDYQRLTGLFRQSGYMKFNPIWFGWALLRLFSFLGFTLWLLLKQDCSPILAGLACAMFWQQAGGLLHDAAHTNITYNIWADGWLAWFFGTVCTGINGDWWKYEHDIHHSLVNSYKIVDDGEDDENGDDSDKDDDDGVQKKKKATKTMKAVDIQMHEDVWAQSLDIIPLFPSEKPFTWLLQYQHFYFMILIFCAGRVGILINAYKTERKIRPWIGLALHFYATYSCLSKLDDKMDAAKFLIASALGEGMLHMQLVVNHYLCGWDDAKSVSENFVRWTCESTYNVHSPYVLDWFHVGLHLHIEHHLFPKVNRNYFRQIQPHVQNLCQKYNMPYHEVHFWAIPIEFYQMFHNVSKYFTTSSSSCDGGRSFSKAKKLS